jgi:hypothetical protein
MRWCLQNGKKHNNYSKFSKLGLCHCTKKSDIVIVEWKTVHNARKCALKGGRV